MSMRPTLVDTIPPETARIAHAAFRKGHPYLALRDTLGPLFADASFADLYAHQGPAGLSPARLAVVTLLQYREGLSDREAADAVRSRLDWKYLLGLPLDDGGFDASVLTEFRDRLQQDGAALRLLTQLLAHARDQGLLKERGQQRTDGTHVVAAVRRLNRLQLVQETMRHVLDVLALVAPTWLLAQSAPEWEERYAGEFIRRLPKTEPARERLAATIGRDGATLLAAIDAPTSPVFLQQVEAVVTLRTVWSQQYEQDDTGPRFRATAELAPAADLTASPYDADARFATRRQTSWTGYMVHLTETCEPDLPCLVVGVETTPATKNDVPVLRTIQADLSQRSLVPGIHLVDAGYSTAAAVLRSQEQYGIRLVAPPQHDSSWQARAGAGFALPDFVLDWDQQTATCPQGKTSSTWREMISTRGDDVVQIHFRQGDCQACPVREQCTTADRRSLTVYPRPIHEARVAAQQADGTAAVHALYRRRAGIEGTISRGVRTAGLRRTRTRGLAQVRLEHLLLGTSLTLARLASWLSGERRTPTRRRPFPRLMAASLSP
ncbi:MAG: IS1182-like element ISGvi6 family transposase [Chloroflexota bacterium]